MEVSKKNKKSSNNFVIIIFLVISFIVGFSLRGTIPSSNTPQNSTSLSTPSATSSSTVSATQAKIGICQTTQYINNIKCTTGFCPDGFSGFYPDCTVSEPKVASMSCYSSGTANSQCTVNYSSGTSSSLSCYALNNQTNCY